MIKDYSFVIFCVTPDRAGLYHYINTCHLHISMTVLTLFTFITLPEILFSPVHVYVTHIPEHFYTFKLLLTTNLQ